MAILGELAVNLVARTTKFEKGLKKSGKQLDKFKTNTEKAKKGLSLMRTAVAGLGASLVGGFITKSIFETAEAVDELAKKASLLNTTTEALGGLRHAAEQTGVEAGVFDTALQRMVRRVAEAATGTGEAKDALNELGVSATELSKLRSDEQFKRIADAMGKIPNHNDQVRLAFKLFDTEGVKVLETLKLGGDGLVRMQEEAKKLGILVSGEEAKRMELFTDEVDKLSKLAGSFKKDFVIDVTPAAVETIQGALLLFEAFKKDKKQGGFFGTQASRALEGENLLQRLSPAAQLGRRATERLFEKTGVGFSAPAIRKSERLKRAPENFLEARGQRNPLDLRELRIAELKELRRESKKGDDDAKQQRQAMIDGLNALNARGGITSGLANRPTIGP